MKPTRQYLTVAGTFSQKDCSMTLTEIQKLIADYTKVRAALVCLVGVDGRKDLEMMNATIGAFPGDETDKAAAVVGIRALLDTLPSEEAAR